MLNDQQFLRYQRQIGLPEIGEEGQTRLRDAHVRIIGCGGLGSVASLYLAGGGVGRIVLVDDDCVDLSNLQRQIAYRQQNIGQAKVEALSQQLKQLNSELSLRCIATRMSESQLTLEVMLADVVLDCSDNLATRQLINQVCFKQKVSLVSGAAIGWQGQFAIYDYSSKGGCYRCLYPFDELPDAKSCSQIGVMGPVVGVLGSYQALAALHKLTTGVFMTTTSQLHLFDGKGMCWQTVKIPKDHHCSVCGKEHQSTQAREVNHAND